MKILEMERELARAQEPQEPREKNKGTREMVLNNIRAMEGEGNERKFTLSFSSEEPYGRWFGMEILDHTNGCVDLSRLNDIGVLLFNHHRDQVLGKITRAWVQGDRGEAEVEFDTDEAAETIYQKVKSGTLKGVSVGYMVDSWEEVMPSKTSADGRFTGPCSIAKKWVPYEISIVSVPADPTVGVGREISRAAAGEPEIRMRELALQINKNYMEVNES
ncbi:MAG: HK97 family phage prohead protease [Lachnospiraceae bacterium]|nr:HK97 family phage prohead protease [Lachnospiraceae bacterium]